MLFHPFEAGYDVYTISYFPPMGGNVFPFIIKS